MSTEAYTYYKLQRRLLNDGPDAAWEDVETLASDKTPEAARETYQDFITLYEKRKPGLYAFRTLRVDMSMTTTQMDWN